MTTEQRQYIIREHHYGKTDKAIATELGISPAAISLDRRRHSEEWEREKEFLEFVDRCVRDRKLDCLIDKGREYLKRLLSSIAANNAGKESLPGPTENPDVRPEFLAMILQIYTDREVELAKEEKEILELLANNLAERYDLE